MEATVIHNDSSVVRGTSFLNKPWRRIFTCIQNRWWSLVYILMSAMGEFSKYISGIHNDMLSPLSRPLVSCSKRMLSIDILWNSGLSFPFQPVSSELSRANL